MPQTVAVDDPDDLRRAQRLVALRLRGRETVFVAQVVAEGQHRMREVGAHPRLARTEPSP